MQPLLDSVRVPSSSPGRANSRRAYLHLKVELQWCVCSTAVSYYGCGYGPVQVRRVFRICEDHEDSEPVSYILEGITSEEKSS